MNEIETEISKFIRDPSENDLRRYNYYIEHGTDSNMVSPLEPEQFTKFYSLIAGKLQSGLHLQPIRDQLRTDILIDYDYAMRKAIVNYVLLNMDERARVKIEWIPRTFATRY